MRIWLNERNDISPPGLYSWASQRESAQDNVGVLSSSSSPAVSSHAWTRRDRNNDPNPGPGFPGPSSPVGCGLGKKRILLSAQNFFVSYHWESCRCSGNTCCCGSIGTPCTDQSLSVLCARLHLRKMNKITREWYFYLMSAFAPTMIVVLKRWKQVWYLSGCCRAWCPCGWNPSCGRCRRHKPIRRCKTWWMRVIFKPQKLFIQKKKGNVLPRHQETLDVSKLNSLGEFFLEDAKLDEQRHQVTARYVIHHKVEVVPILNVEIWRGGREVLRKD